MSGPRPLAAVYAAVPDIACRGLCAGACGPIVCHGVEASALQDVGVSLPTTVNHPVQGPLTCSHLTAEGRCAIYAQRPLVCRLFGVVPEMVCPHGCRPAAGALTSRQAEDLIHELSESSRVAGLKSHCSLKGI